MEIRGFQWDSANENHIRRHRLEPEETEEVFLGPCFIRKTHSDRYVAFGQSLWGRYLLIVFEHIGRDVIRIVTARDMDKREKSFYRRFKK